MTLQGTKNLENWCKHVTDGKVNVVNMSTSWRNGLGFCAIIHHFRPDLIDFENLDPDDVYGNNELAFRVAEAHLGIPALLDPADMLECSIPDRLSILTYLSQFYHAFHSANLKHKKIGGGSQTSSEASTPSKSSSSTTATMLRSRAKESCYFCQKPVFILERINVAGHLLHRTCFKCRRCDTQLSIVNFYETEAGEFCCDMCPDEEKNHVEVTSANKKIVEDWSGAGEEKPKTTTVNATDEDRAQNNDTSLTETKTTDDNQNNNSKENIENNNSVDNNNSVLPDNVTEDVGDSTPDNHVTKVVPDEVAVAVAVVVEEVMADEVMNSAESSSKTDDERLVEHSDQQVEVAADPHLAESSDEELHEKNESEKSEKEEKLPEELVVVAKSENVDAKTDDIKCVEASSKVDRDETPEVNEKEKSASHHDDKDVCDAIEEEIYPDDLNPFGDEEEKKVDEEIRIVSSSNPFGSDDEDEEEPRTSPMSPNSIAVSAKGTPLVGPPKPPRISLNPFGSDFEDDDEEANNDVTPKLSRVPKPPLSPTLSCASGTSARKKRHAPPPPKTAPPIPSPRTSLKTSTPGAELRRSAPPRPPPPCATPSQPKERKERENLNRRSQQLLETSIDSKTVDSTKSNDTKLTEVKSDDAKSTNDSKTNEIKSRDKATLPSDIVLTQLPPNKASEGVWKKKKGPAPPRPIPPKLQVKKLPRKAVNQELHDIEVKQQELERQGVKLEKTIRELCEKSDSERLEKGLDNNDRDSLGPEAEDLIMQLFELVNEKNDLYRRQTELMYMKREHRLEEEHADIEYQIRVLMSKAETLRTDDEKLKEEKLISRLMEIVAQRNEIVDCLEMDRLRELEEDESIEVHMGEFAAVRPPEGEEKTKKKKKEKEKKKKKKDKVHDDDKDIDTSENGGATPKSSPKKGPLGSGGEKDLAKKMKKKIMSTLKPVVLNKKST